MSNTRGVQVIERLRSRGLLIRLNQYQYEDLALEIDNMFDQRDSQYTTALLARGAGGERLREMLEVAKARLEEATNWHQYGTGHDDDSWCCKREEELRDEVMALEMAAPATPPLENSERLRKKILLDAIHAVQNVKGEWKNGFLRICTYEAVQAIKALAAPATPTAPTRHEHVMWQSAVSGLWYEHPEAAGSISAVEIGERRFKVIDPEVDSTAPSEGEK